LIGYLNGKFDDLERLHISPLDRGFLFADGVYEVWMCYDGRRFADEQHWQRLKASLAGISLPFPNLQGCRSILDQLVERNAQQKGTAGIYLQITRGVAPRKHAFPEATSPTLFAYSFPFQRPREALASGVSVHLIAEMRWTRCDIKSIALLGNVLAKEQAKGHGAFEALFVREGHVVEGTHSNLFAVRRGALWTHPLGPFILGGITRAHVLQLARSAGMDVREQALTVEELFQADEVFLTGTTTELMPVIQVEDRSIGDGRPGAITRELQRLFWKSTAFPPPLEFNELP
jgi:D-alanine transaminase